MKFYENTNYEYGSVCFDVDLIEKRLYQGLETEARALFVIALRKKYSLKETAAENIAWYKLLRMLPSLFPLTFIDRVWLCLRRLRYRNLMKQGQIKNVLVTDMLPAKTLLHMRQEIRRHEPLWTVNTGRSQSPLSPHSKTNAIELFARNPEMARSSVFDTADQQWRYATQTELAKAFPTVTKWLLDFERDMGGQLGRAVLVRLKPHSCVYGHCDSEWKLRGFDRYHVVIDSRGGSYMQSGDEHALCHNGEVFFFENKKWHTAYNRSPHWRVHIIVDIRLDKERNRSLPVYSYQDWQRWKDVVSHDA